MVREIIFYKDRKENCPVIDFINSIKPKAAKKITWVLKLIQEMDIVPKQYFKKLVDTDEIWECRIQSGSDIYRLLCFLHKGNYVVLTHGFQKKSRKTPKNEIVHAENLKQDYLSQEAEEDG